MTGLVAHAFCFMPMSSGFECFVFSKLNSSFTIC